MAAVFMTMERHHNKELLEKIEAGDMAWFDTDENDYKNRDKAVQIFSGKYG